MGATRNSEGFREILSEDQQKEPWRAKLAGRREAAEGVRSPCDLGSKSVVGRPKVAWKRQETSHLCIRRREGRAGRA